MEGEFSGGFGLERDDEALYHITFMVGSAARCRLPLDICGDAKVFFDMDLSMLLELYLSGEFFHVGWVISGLAAMKWL